MDDQDASHPKREDLKSEKPSDSLILSEKKHAAAHHDDDVQAVDASQSKDEKHKKNGKKHNLWWIKAAIISLVLGAFVSFLSELTSSSGQIVVTVLLLAFLILASILFDAIGVAVTSCDTKPFVSMASRKIYGAKTAIKLAKNSDKVSSVCNDIIGDIFGIISGSCSAVIVFKIVVELPQTWQKVVSILISAVVSAVTIGGKAFMKNIAIKNSKDFVMFVARILAIFSKEERANRKKTKQKNKKMSAKDKDSGANE